LVTHQSSLGGTTSVTYVPGTEWTNTQAAPPGIMATIDASGNHSAAPSTHRLSPGGPTVSSIQVSDGRVWSATTTYAYSGGLYDEDERKWLGYQYSTETRPKIGEETAGPSTLSEFVQKIGPSIGAAGALKYQLQYDGLGKELDAVFNEVVVGGDGEASPYTAKVSWRMHYLLDGSGTDCTLWPCAYGERRWQEFTYDNHGNRTLVKDHGNLDAAGDETTTQFVFYPNSSAYLVNKLARTTAYFGIGTTGMVLTDAQLHYDGAATYALPPTIGLLTNRSNWLNDGNRWIAQCPDAACIEYDAFGNVTKVKESKWINGSPTPVSAETVLQYETGYDKFPISVTNALGQVTQTPDWDELCEAPARTVNPNLQETTVTYDELCRHDRTEGPLGSFLQSFYVGLGNPNSQYSETQTPSAEGTGVYWAKTFFDGLGRTYQTESRSGEPGKNVLSGEVTFNARGLAATAAQPRFTGDPQYLTTFTYD
ncbi:MAG: toxin TcdB middle/N-terminal domain-containing protein, partial [Vicinamibacteria bacterium]